ncbi:MAG: hypothetical protein KDD53_04450 [Bdellovibrionales bacterium]|nr:hypothetical protein [Bdellovibrionales bacterium]
MKRKILVILLIVLVILASLLGYAAYNANSLIAAFKPKFEKSVAKALGAPIKLGEIEVAVFPTTKLKVAQISVGNQDNNSGQFKLNDLLLSVNPLALLGGKLEVTKVTISKPEIVIIKTKDRYSVAGLEAIMAKRSSEAKSTLIESSHAKDQKDKAGSAKSPIDISVDRISIEDLAITLRSSESENSLPLAILSIGSQIQIDPSGINIPKLDINGSLLESGRLQLNGSIANAGKPESALNLTGNIDHLKSSSLSSLTSLLGINLPIELDGEIRTNFLLKGTQGTPDPNLTLDLTDLSIKKAGVFEKPPGTLAKIDLHPNLSDGSSIKIASRVSVATFSMNALKNDLKSIELNPKILTTKNLQSVNLESGTLVIGKENVSLSLKAKTNLHAIDLDQLLLSGFGGSFTSKAKVDKNSNIFNLEGSASSISIQRILEAADSSTSAALSGNLKSLAFKLSGNQTRMPQSLSGNIKLDLVDGALQGDNLAGKALKAVKGIPFISGDLYSELSPENQKALDSDSTAIRSLQATLRVNGNSLQTNDLSLVSDIFSLSAQGTVDLSGSLSLTSQMKFEAGFSSSLVKKIKELKGLQNSAGEVVIPVLLKGAPPAIVVLPDIEEILKLTAGKMILDKVGKKLGVEGLGELFGGKSSSSSGANKKSGGLGGILGF